MRNALCIWLLCLALGCSDSESGNEGGNDAGRADGGSASVLSVATFNTGLAAVVKGSTERLPHIREAVKGSDHDLLCLQELFDPIVIADFAAAVADSYPHSFSSELGDSALGNGLLILSRHPLSNGKTLLFEAADPLGLTDRMTIAADVDLDGETVHVTCSHLQAGLDTENTEVRKQQVDELVAFATAEGYLAGASVLLGDFNLGPDPVAKCSPESDPPCLAPDEANYARLLETVEDPNEGWAQCTQCREVFLPMQVFPLYDDEPDQRIDHCFTGSPDRWRGVDRRTVFDDEVSIEVQGTGGPEVLTTLSDHLGVECELSRVD